MLVITGASGAIGGKITNRLLDQGKKVRVIGRNAERLKTFVDRGAEAFVGDLADTEFLTKAFTGATCVFAILPTDMKAVNIAEHQNRVGESIATAIRNAGVKQVINLSSLGAHLREKTGIIQGLHNQEERLNNIRDLNVVHLRPAYFMENILSVAEMVKGENMVGTPLDGALRFPAIATRDVADVAVTYLLNPTFKGHTVRNLLGQRDVNYNEIVKVIGTTIGNKNLKYVQFPYDKARTYMIKSGISDSTATALTEMMRIMNEGPLYAEARRTQETTTPTTIEEFTKSVANYFKR